MEIEQRSDEWFTARLGKATASNFDKIMKTNRDGSPSAMRKGYCLQVALQRLTGVGHESYSNTAIEWGVMYEPVARLRYELETGTKVDEVGFLEHPTLAAGASPDGLIDEGIGGLEIKCPNSTTHYDTLLTGLSPKEYYAQMQGQMWIGELEYVDFVSFDPRMPEPAQLVIIRVPRDDLYIARLEEEVIVFLEEVDMVVDRIKNYESKA